MRTTTLLISLSALLSTAFAADSDCAAQNIVDACVSGYQTRISGCQKNSNDWDCLCSVYTDVLTCYNNCPDSNERPPVQNQVTQFCAAAAPIRSASLASAASVAATAVSTSTPVSASATSTRSGSATGTGAAATASAFATGAASSLTTPAGAAAVVLMAAAGLL